MSSQRIVLAQLSLAFFVQYAVAILPTEIDAPNIAEWMGNGSCSRRRSVVGSFARRLGKLSIGTCDASLL